MAFRGVELGSLEALLKAASPEYMSRSYSSGLEDSAIGGSFSYNSNLWTDKDILRTLNCTVRCKESRPQYAVALSYAMPAKRRELSMF